MKKRILAAAMACLLLVSLAGCSSGGNGGGSSEDSQAETSGEGASSSSDEGTQEKIKVGYDIYFLGNSWSVQLYQEFKWNAENNYADKVDVTYVESDNDITKQIANIEDLIAQGYLTPAVLIFTPVFLPIARSIGMSDVHFGLMLIMNLVIGSVTPPVGSVLFVGCGVGKVKIEGVTRYILPMFVAMVAALFLVTYIPAIPLIVPYLCKLVPSFWWN